MPTARERALTLVPTLVARAAATEKSRTPLPENIADLKAAGLHRLAQPRRFGGEDLPFDQIADVVSVLARGCAATGWVFGIYNDHAIMLSKFDPRAADDVWQRTPDAVIATGYIPSGTAEKVEGGYRISGTWSFASGCDYADWIFLGSMLPRGEAGPTACLCLMPRSEVTIEDNWNFLGLQGTGSKNLVAKDVFIPEYRTLPLAAMNAGSSDTSLSPLQRLPHVSNVPFVFAATGLGIAESLLDLMVDAISSRSSVVGAKLAELQSMHLHIAEAAAEIDCARMLMIRDLQESMAVMTAGGMLSLDHKARNRRDQAYVGKLCRRAVDRLFALAGSRGMYLDHAAQRKFRDICAVSSHISTSWDIAGTVYGRVKLGLDPATMMI